MSKQPDPPLTVEQFYEKTLKLNEIYQHNQQSLYQDFMKKQEALFLRMSEEDRKIVVDREKAKMQEAVSKIVTQTPGLVDRTGRKITTH